jgi:DNA-binding NarL/FixJ family response regulator
MSDTAAGPIRLLVVDDHALFRDALAQVLENERDFTVTGACSSVQQAMDFVRRRQIDVVLLDVDLGKEEGGEFLRQSAAEGFPVKVIVVTAGVHQWEAERLLERGASAIFLKTGTDEDLFQLIRDVVSGRPAPIASLPLATGDEALGKPQHRPLTTRQHDVLRLIVQGKSNKEIAWDLGLQESQVKQAIQGLFQKTGVRTRGQLVRVAIESYWEELASPPGG